LDYLLVLFGCVLSIILNKMDEKFVWSKIFTKSADNYDFEYRKRMENVCEWLSRAYNEKNLTRNETGNMMLRIRKDFFDPDSSEYWLFISESLNYGDFLRNIPEYTCIREIFPSRDKEPLEEICYPWSNEKLYGKGINSNVREGM